MAMLSDLHIHSTYSDGKLSIREIVDLYGRAKFDVIAITDHLCESNNLIGYVSHKLKRSISEENFGQYMEEIHREAFRAMRKYGMLVIPGVEVTKNSFCGDRSSHFIILNPDSCPNANETTLDILKEFKSTTTALIAAHPLHTGKIEFQSLHLWNHRETFREVFDAWEVSSFQRYFFEVESEKLPQIASSDFHNHSHFSSWKTLLYCRQKPADVVDAIKMQALEIIYYRSQESQPAELTQSAIFSEQHKLVHSALV
ncbi:MAG: PHP domain-containing protein [Bdellovibrionales bacterium]|nr:PHP domain-containing protein [Bdellovibrionales bacterium]